jgi:hypothetical protein
VRGSACLRCDAKEIVDEMRLHARLPQSNRKSEKREGRSVAQKTQMMVQHPMFLVKVYVSGRRGTERW